MTQQPLNGKKIRVSRVQSFLQRSPRPQRSATESAAGGGRHRAADKTCQIVAFRRVDSLLGLLGTLLALPLGLGTLGGASLDAVDLLDHEGAGDSENKGEISA